MAKGTVKAAVKAQETRKAADVDSPEPIAAPTSAELQAWKESELMDQAACANRGGIWTGADYPEHGRCDA